MKLREHVTGLGWGYCSRRPGEPWERERERERDR